MIDVYFRYYRSWYSNEKELNDFWKCKEKATRLKKLMLDSWKFGFYAFVVVVTAAFARRVELHRRTPISKSGWLARVGKKRKTGK
jgi:hypothetical protein